ncbi:hypothetical protein M413DRAFT_21405 [Hebeloma cylindrosporum]|uniref:Uncharacterized protein n=1 Tax=Hebeloma cylindrosporum TaxID=76867 RepID=A0A0C3CK99_HEBCY|nr:hypothetical protein M413DRAFT_21405 [Hebeloma cylindrosporum h7]
MSRVPSLVACCVQALATYVDQAYALPVPLRLRSRLLIDQLVPDHLRLDPRLWATIVQVFDAPLPPAFASHTLPLLHAHQPLLQAIPSTSKFSLITVLFLPGCVHLTDATIHHLKTLHTLSAFDASNTSLSDYAIQTLAATLFLDEEDCDPSGRKYRGPWPLRILALRNCKQITDRVFDYLDKFPLLSVLDLRGSLCSPNATDAFYPFSNAHLYHPSSLATALATLQEIQPDIHSSCNVYLLNVTTFRPTRPPSKSTTVTPQDAFVVIPSHPNSRIKVGNTVILERQFLEKEDALRHEINKEAWYERQEILESRQYELEQATKRIKKSKSQHVQSNSSQQGTIFHNPPSNAHSNRAGYLARPLTEISLPRKSTLKRSGVSEPAPTRFGRVQTPVYAVRPRSPVATAQQPCNRTAVVLDPSVDNTPQRPNAGSSNQFYQPLSRFPQKPTRPSSASPTLRSHLSDSTMPTGSSRCKDDLLMLYRDPPVWSTLNAVVNHKRSDDGTSSQHRGWQRMRPPNEMAIVDMNSAKAVRLRQRLGEFVEREVTNKQQRVYNCEHGSGSDNHLPFLRPPADPSIFVPITSSQSRNPFKKHPVVQIEPNENLMTRPMGHKQSFSINEANGTKPLIPISALKIPVLPLGVRKATLVPETVGSSGHAGADASKRSKARNSPVIPEMTKEARRRGAGSDREALPATKSRRERPSGTAFDRKSWGKPC